jgi:hypothetical protein
LNYVEIIAPRLYLSQTVSKLYVESH